MKRVKVRFSSRQDSRVMTEVMKRGQVVCLPDLTFLVPDPAIDLLNELGAQYENLGEESWDRVVRAIRNPSPSNV